LISSLNRIKGIRICDNIPRLEFETRLTATLCRKAVIVHKVMLVGSKDH